VPKSRIIHPDEAPVHAQATVALISRVQRPYLFRVRVEGQFPHNRVREYDLTAVNEAAAAFEGIKIFERQMSKTAVIRDLIIERLNLGGH
jgi:hypothetical protein